MVLLACRSSSPDVYGPFAAESWIGAGAPCRCRARTARRRVDARGTRDLQCGGRRHSDGELGQFAVDVAVSHSGFSFARRMASRAVPGTVGRRRGLRLLLVSYLLADSLRCRRRPAPRRRRHPRPRPLPPPRPTAPSCPASRRQLPARPAPDGKPAQDEPDKPAADNPAQPARHEPGPPRAFRTRRPRRRTTRIQPRCSSQRGAPTHPRPIQHHLPHTA